jgi:hypothetical protein
MFPNRLCGLLGVYGSSSYGLKMDIGDFLAERRKYPPDREGRG